jgi:hypothetical protein
MSLAKPCRAHSEKRAQGQWRECRRPQGTPWSPTRAVATEILLIALLLSSQPRRIEGIGDGAVDKIVGVVSAMAGNAWAGERPLPAATRDLVTGALG